MRLLLDINVLLDVIFERPGQAASAELITRCGSRDEGWLAWHSLATLFYLVAKQSSAEQARSFVADLLAWARVAPTTHDHALLALELPMADYEDALQSAAAVACGADLVSLATAAIS
jgi:predicted nucleic acid-binding protein